eukprot:5800409-Amphidinium_carterae.1
MLHSVPPNERLQQVYRRNESSIRQLRYLQLLSPVKTTADEARQLPTFRQLLTTLFNYTPENRAYNILRNKDTTKRLYVDKNELYEKMNYRSSISYLQRRHYDYGR